MNETALHHIFIVYIKLDKSREKPPIEIYLVRFSTGVHVANTKRKHCEFVTYGLNIFMPLVAHNHNNGTPRHQACNTICILNLNSFCAFFRMSPLIMSANFRCRSD